MTEVKRYRAVVAYDGSAFLGFQRQADGLPSVQAALEAALLAVSGQTATVIGAGRTDTGVHAVGQVIAFEIAWAHGERALLSALNIALPPEIALQRVEVAPARFNPRFSANTRTYRYLIFQSPVRHPLIDRFVWQVPFALDSAALRDAAKLVVGERDFGAFGKPPTGESTVRRVQRSEWSAAPYDAGTLWTYRIEANAFLQRMVRRLVGTMVEVGRGVLTVAEFNALLERTVPPRKFPTAPARGLCFERVIYDRPRGNEPS